MTRESIKSNSDHYEKVLRDRHPLQLKLAEDIQKRVAFTRQQEQKFNSVRKDGRVKPYTKIFDKIARG